ncbi:hypothetical protein [Sediminibacterium sp.]|uniref:hypothetical protein n=1 Tax=Sediminibacterium sp. TaxID=1917865 RepID=UPI003F714706
MKKILFLLLLFFSCMISFAQQTEKKTIHVTTNPHLKKFLKLNEKQKHGILLEPLTVKEYPQQITLSDSLKNRLLGKQLVKGELHTGLTNTMPVWSPGSDYVFNMPGTFAFDKNQVRVHIPRFVTVVNHKKVESPEKNIVPTQE